MHTGTYLGSILPCHRLERLPYESQAQHHRDVVEFVRSRHKVKASDGGWLGGHDVRVGTIQLDDVPFISEFVEALRALPLGFFSFETHTSSGAEYGLSRIAQVLPSCCLEDIRVILRCIVDEGAFEKFLQGLRACKMQTIEISGVLFEGHVRRLMNYCMETPTMVAMHVSGVRAHGRFAYEIAESLRKTNLRTLNVSFHDAFLCERDLLNAIRLMQFCPRVANLSFRSPNHNVTEYAMTEIERISRFNALVRVNFPGYTNYYVDYIKETDWYIAAIHLLAAKTLQKFQGVSHVQLLPLEIIRAILELFSQSRKRIFRSRKAQLGHSSH